MKKLIYFMLFCSVTAFANPQDDLNLALITASGLDDVKTAVQLLNQGADATKTVKTKDGVVAPALYVASLNAARNAENLVYKELVRRHVSLNTAVDLGWNESVSVLEFLLSEAGTDKVKFETFFLEFINDGANPFAQGAYSTPFAYLVLNDYNKVVNQLMTKEISKQSWLWVTHQWTMRYKNFAGEEVPMQKLMAQFEKYFPIAQKAGVSIYDWGFYGPDEEKPNGPILFQQSAALEFVRYKMNTTFINAFIARGFDVNKIIRNNKSMCSSANVISVQDVQTLVDFGCHTTNQWTLSALIAEQYKTAEKVLSLGIDIDAPFMVYGTSYTVLTFLRSLDFKPQAQIDWALNHGANPNQPQPEE